jgi:hypothetical protein
MTSRFMTRLLMLLLVATLAAFTSGCEAVVGVGVGVGYPYGPYGPYGGYGGYRPPWGRVGGWVGGPVLY